MAVMAIMIFPLVVSRVTKMVYSSSLLEANFVTMAQRQEQMVVAEKAKKMLTIQQLNKVSMLQHIML